MVRAWYMQDAEGKDQRDPLQLDPPQPVGLDKLRDIGVLHWNIDIDEAGEYRNEGSTLANLKLDRGYITQKTSTFSPKAIPDYEKALKALFAEHLHTGEEVSLTLDGSGYLDVRDVDERWIRMELLKGDLFILPPGIYHRFTLDVNDYLIANRLFTEGADPTQHYRPADHIETRKAYLATLQKVC